MQQRMPDALVLDWMMPPPDGLSVCHSIRENPAQRHLPCLLYTSIVLAMGRIVGETAALLFTVGVSGFRLPEELFGHIMGQGLSLIHI